MSFELTGCNLKKVFNRRVIFQEIAFALKPQQTLLITGPNGSGKSTLVKIICGVLTPSEGDVVAKWSETMVVSHMYSIVGLVSPYLQMYDEFSPRENLQFALSVRNMKSAFHLISPLLERLELKGRLDEPVRTFSSGMKQRVKYAFALIHQPPILVLDEPMANLDSNGVELVRQIMSEQRRAGMLIVATNDTSDVDVFDEQVNLGA